MSAKSESKYSIQIWKILFAYVKQRKNKNRVLTGFDLHNNAGFSYKGNNVRFRAISGCLLIHNILC